MLNVTDYGLAATELAGALMVLAFARGLLLYARSWFRPGPALDGVVPPKLGWFVQREAPVSSVSPAEPLEGSAPVSAAPPGPLVGELLPPVPDAPAAADLPLSAVILATESLHTEVAPDGSRSLHWSRRIFRRVPTGS